MYEPVFSTQLHQLWYTPFVDDSRDRRPILAVAFYRTAAGNEPVRDWLHTKTAQYGWPLGMPLIRKLEPELWEVRSHLADAIARVLFTVDGEMMVPQE